MTYKWEKEGKKIPSLLDKRRKIQENEHKDIRKRNKEGEAIRAIARSYGVDKRLIQFIVCPERKERSKELYKERRKDGRYYLKEKATLAIRKHRRYKQSIADKLV